MRTAVDSNVLLDVFLPDPAHLQRSMAALERATAAGSVVACDLVVAEVAGQFRDLDAAMETFAAVGLELTPVELAAAFDAGRGWREYRRRGGARGRMLADFMVAAHALHHADALLARDRGYYRTYFPSLKLLSP